MKKISKFDLGAIIAFVVVALLGGGAYWWLTGQLDTAQQDVAAAKRDFDTYSIKQGIVVSHSNKKTLQDNIDLINAQIDPLIQTKFQAKENKLPSITKEDPVAWKHRLDDEVRRLTAAANHHSVKIPPNFYFSFSRYLNINPEDEQTVALSKQLLAVEQIVNVLVNAPVKEIKSIRRTYEEDSHSAAPPDDYTPGTEPDRLKGYAFKAGPGGEMYTDYPFEVDFDTTTESFRKVMDDLMQPPYVFVVRTLTVSNLSPDSPQLSDLDRIAGTPAPSVVDSSPGAVAATISTQPPQFLFGNVALHVKARIDLIEWTAPVRDNPTDKPSSPGSH